MMSSQINGILNINKPKGMTSFDVIAKLRRLLNTKKIGHTGTLDPDATGVLPVCIGKATKVSELIMGRDKCYIAQITFGIETDTQDAQGTVVNQAKNVEINELELKRIVESFIGEYEQIPPMYSAIKIKGKKLYELAREGKEIEREARRVYINSIKITDIDLNKEFPTARIEVNCSKGTYIRTLCYDIGKKIGSGAHMSSLIRTCSGDFKLEESITLCELEEQIKNDNLHRVLIPVDKIFSNLDSIRLNSKQAVLFNNGVMINAKELNVQFENLNEDKLYKVYNDKKEFVALAKIQLQDGKSVLKNYKSF